MLLFCTSSVVADERCQSCHPKEVQSFLKTGMGRSIARPKHEDAPDGRVQHALSGTTLEATWQNGKLLHRIARQGHTSSYPMAWAVGSGNQGRTYLFSIGDALFESPLSWYASRRLWDLSPGYEQDKRPDFYRPVTSDCLFCHSGKPQPVAGTQNRYTTPPFDPASISCDRCHGNPARHLQSHSRADIVNPTRLEPERRDAVCEQCHLSGVARILNAGKQLGDFQPGMRIEDVFTVFVQSTKEPGNGLKVVSHSEQLAASRCSQRSGGRLWCGTCHSTHRAAAKDAADLCDSCHTPKDMGQHRAQSGADCVSCHLPRLRAADGGHTVFTDHRIRIRSHAPESPAKPYAELKAWREPPAHTRQRNLALAYVGIGRLDRALPLLKADPSDGASETARGAMLLRAGRVQQAVQAFRHALQQSPDDSMCHLNLAAALSATGDLQSARKHAEAAIAIEPLLEDAYVLLAELEPQRAAEWKRRYQRLVPQRQLP